MVLCLAERFYDVYMKNGLLLSTAGQQIETGTCTLYMGEEALALLLGQKRNNTWERDVS
jgi:hypothetical protein